ncbi:uncharacterized protein LOC120636422 [Pararge aegeria]|uniref:Jg873 protein n=1 Tax=Pararge aegeria aegeria TaxID=348720 RepID=A0A8S4R241_9NEOP|nr:uncharacterized protein LOC120636422 [Pararge aegeria]CAH2228344.1 jg873 [Pararge aegeria aegeria]
MLVAEKKEMEEREINKRTDTENNGHPDPQTYTFKNESGIREGPDSSSSSSPSAAARREEGFWGSSPYRDPTTSFYERDQFGDPISPHSDYQGTRTDYWQTWDATGTNDIAAQPPICVSVTTTPRIYLTRTETSAILDRIQLAIFVACTGPLTPSQTRYAPAFQVNAIHSEGVLKMWCNDERSLFWLEETVSRMSSPMVGTALTVTVLSKIQLRSRLELYVPNFEGGMEQLHQILSVQNPWYNVSLWALFRYVKLTGNPPGVFLILGVPSEELPKIMARDLKVAYLTGTINIRLFQDTDISQNSELGATTILKMEAEDSTDSTATTASSVIEVLDTTEDELSDLRT